MLVSLLTNNTNITDQLDNKITVTIRAPLKIVFFIFKSHMYLAP